VRGKRVHGGITTCLRILESTFRWTVYVVAAGQWAICVSIARKDVCGSSLASAASIGSSHKRPARRPPGGWPGNRQPSSRDRLGKAVQSGERGKRTHSVRRPRGASKRHGVFFLRGSFFLRGGSFTGLPQHPPPRSFSRIHAALARKGSQSFFRTSKLSG
jgi:hypothetical protein